MRVAVALATILLLVGFLGALGVVIADWRRLRRRLKKHLRWQELTSAWTWWAP